MRQKKAVGPSAHIGPGSHLALVESPSTLAHSVCVCANGDVRRRVWREHGRRTLTDRGRGRMADLPRRTTVRGKRGRDRETQRPLASPLKRVRAPCSARRDASMPVMPREERGLRSSSVELSAVAMGSLDRWETMLGSLESLLHEEESPGYTKARYEVLFCLYLCL